MKNRRAEADRIAFTLIEMVVALVLASLMMVGLLRIVTLVSIESNQLRGEQTDYVAAGMLADRLRMDLMNARGIVADFDSIRLSGYVGPQNTPGTIRYGQSIVGNRRVLVRDSGDQREVCWVGFGGFDFESYEQITAETPQPEMTGGLPPVPARFRIGVMNSDGRLLFSEVIQHHEQ
ncbi:MAG: prepilin-type N-terminal cleavage/methylation domain-containing protein [Planctomycetales bacterium]|nr:prepilin-type N-terminal cleavage/methylation domain-containing protein [Planctomycetales bacterium]